MQISHVQTTDETTLLAASMHGLGEIRIAHPPNTFSITPASLIAIQAVATNQHLLAGNGLDWGSGTGCLAIAAAKITVVERIIGLEISQMNVAVAQKNAMSNAVQHKTSFFISDSYLPISAVDRAQLTPLMGQTNFILANPPASDGDDGFGWRRRVLGGARAFLAAGGRVFLNISSQYGQARIEGLCANVPGFTYGGVMATTDWVPFDLRRADLFDCLELYAMEEARGGLDYVFRDAVIGDRVTARSALAKFNCTEESPLMKWQTHLFEWMIKE